MCVHVSQLLDSLFILTFKNHSDIVSVIRSCTLLTCTAKGNATVKSFEINNSSTKSDCIGSSTSWNVCASGNICCCKVDGSEKYALFGG